MRVMLFINRQWTGDVGGVNQWDIDIANPAANTITKVGGAYKLNDIAASVNGGAVTVDTSATIPTVTTLGVGNSASSNYLNGHIRQITYIPRRLSNAELQARTV